MTDHQTHARRWASALITDTSTVLDLYADDLVFDDHRDRDHVLDTAITKDELAPRLAVYSNRDLGNGAGIHEFRVDESYPLPGVNGLPSVVILWSWTGEGLESYRGVPAGGRMLTTRGITWHQLDSLGRITREVTYWNDTPVLQELGIPIVTPEYWVEGFDPATLAGA
ncbi:ketosteroid isomerase-related protein [Nocardia harenae]|uniref:ketosteroid isomerase-related protein n=1 Tax=Nocardia harenae TaxID=358707 RepID=UPI00082D8291|nr:ketosteroid isomerase-related protein [Nocardia harenae]